MKHSLATAAAFVAAVLLGACERDPIVITCDPARAGAECLLDGIPGQCLPTCDDGAHYCAFPARDCLETHLAFGPLSASYSNACVDTCSLASDAGPADASAADANAADAGPADADAADAEPSDAHADGG
jgi:hypothetical protein